MRSWLSCNHRHRRRSSYEKGARQSGKGEQGEPEEKAEAAVGEGSPEGPASALAPPEPLLTFKDVPPAAGLQLLPTLPRPAPCPEITALVQELEAVREFQSCHRRERKKDLRSCRDCLRSLKTLREHLQAVKGRLWRVEAKLGIHVPAQELDPEDEEDEEGGEGEDGQSSSSLAPLSGVEAPEEQHRAESSS